MVPWDGVWHLRARFVRAPLRRREGGRISSNVNTMSKMHFHGSQLYSCAYGELNAVGIVSTTGLSTGVCTHDTEEFHQPDAAHSAGLEMVVDTLAGCRARIVDAKVLARRRPNSLTIRGPWWCRDVHKRKTIWSRSSRITERTCGEGRSGLRMEVENTI